MFVLSNYCIPDKPHTTQELEVYQLLPDWKPFLLRHFSVIKIFVLLLHTFLNICPPFSFLHTAGSFCTEKTFGPAKNTRKRQFFFCGSRVTLQTSAHAASPSRLISAQSDSLLIKPHGKQWAVFLK